MIPINKGQVDVDAGQARSTPEYFGLFELRGVVDFMATTKTSNG